MHQNWEKKLFKDDGLTSTGNNSESVLHLFGKRVYSWGKNWNEVNNARDTSLVFWKDSFLWTDLRNQTLYQTEFLYFVYCWNPGWYWYFLNFQFFIFCEIYLNLPNSNQQNHSRRKPPSFKKTLFVCLCLSCLQELMRLYHLIWYSDYRNWQKYYQVWIQHNRVHVSQQEWVKKNSLLSVWMDILGIEPRDSNTELHPRPFIQTNALYFINFSE